MRPVLIVLMLWAETALAEGNPKLKLGGDDIEVAAFKDFEQWNSKCRSTTLSGMDDSFACGARYQAAKILFLRGWCYGERDQRSAYFRWHACARNSNTPAEMAAAPH